MKNLIDSMVALWGSHGTRILGWLGTVQSCIGVVAGVSGIIPEDHLKYWLAVSGVLGVLTIRRGTTNASRQQDP